MTIRIYTLARELGTDNYAIIDLCRQIGVGRVGDLPKGKDVDSKSKSVAESKLYPLSPISDEDADLVRKHFKESRSER